MSRTFIIAETGSTHDGIYARMLSMIRQAADAGADVVKFQWTSNPTQMAERRNAAELAEAYQRLAWPAEWHQDLARACRINDIEYMCTVYLPEDVAVIAPHVERFKVASFEAGDDELLNTCDAQGKPVIVSLGMMDEDAVFNLVDWWRATETVSHEALLCTSAYPCPLSDLNLAFLRWGIVDGLSDHSAHVLTGALAVAAGAQILEVHFRPDDCDPQNPDYPHSLTPEQLRQYIANVRFAELTMGDGCKRVMPSEQANLKYRVRG